MSEQAQTIDKFQRFKNLFKGDKIIWIIFFLICTISVVEVYSSSAALGFKSGNYWYAPSYHAFLLFVGFIIMLCVLNVPCKYFKVMTPIMVPTATVLLILVFFIGNKENDAARWIKLFGIIPLQPSELAKGAVVLATAHILSQMQTAQGASSKAMRNVLFVAVPTCGLILPENFSTAALLGVTVFLMLIIGRVPLKQLGILVSVVIGIVIVAVTIVWTVGQTEPKAAAPEPTMNSQQLTETVAGTQGTEEKKVGHTGVLHRLDLWKARIEKFSDNTYVAPQDYDLDANGQVGHANIAISNGGLLGVGPGNSVQRDFLPLAFSDFIYAIIAEELGWVGATFVAFLYISLLFRTGYIANRCVNTFPAYLAMGLAIMIVLQALFNMCVAVGLGPVTGQPLPLISKGGTSSIISCMYIGVILSVSRTAQMREDIDKIDI